MKLLNLGIYYFFGGSNYGKFCKKTGNFIKKREDFDSLKFKFSFRIVMWVLFIHGFSYTALYKYDLCMVTSVSWFN